MDLLANTPSSSSMKYSSSTPQLPTNTKYKHGRRSFLMMKSSDKRLNLQPSINRSLNTSLILEDDNHKFDLENIGLTIPVMVSEALNSDRNVNPNSTVSFFDNGWIVLVVGKRLFIWHQGNSVKSLNCKELVLPVSDLAHRAELVCLITSRDDTGTLGCLAASPEGVLRYWPRINNGEVFVESAADLRGEECARLLPCYFGGTFALVTRSSSVLLATCGSRQEGGLSWRLLRFDTGFLRGWGRRMSSFFSAGTGTAGGLPLHAVLTRPLVVEQENGVLETRSGCELLLAAGGQLQRWEISCDEEKKEMDINIDRLLREEFAKGSTKNVFDLEHSISVWDMAIRGKDVFIVGKLCSPESVQIYLGVFNLDNVEFVSVCTFTPSMGVPLDCGADCDTALLRIPHDGDSLRSGTMVFLVWPTAVLVVEALNGRTAGRLDLSAVGERLLGSTISPYEGGLLIFTKRNGLLVLRPKQDGADATSHSFFRTPISAAPRNTVRSTSAHRHRHTFPANVLQRSASENQSGLDFFHSSVPAAAVAASDERDAYRPHSNIKDALLEAFQLYCHGNVNPASAKVRCLVEQQGDEFGGCLLNLADDILDDAPANDPRWAETTAAKGSGPRAAQLAASSDSVFIGQQLADKARALEALCDFLQAAELWSSLGGVMLEDGVEYCVAGSLELRGERLAGMRALRESQSLHTSTLEPVLRGLVQDESDNTPPGLTYNDLFYRRATALDVALSTLVRQAETEAMSDVPLRQVSDLLLSTSNLVVGSLREAAAWRRSRSASASSLPAPSLLASNEPIGLRSVSVQLCAVLTRHLTQHLGDAGVRGQLTGLLVETIDLVLAALTAQHARSATSDEDVPATTNLFVQQLSGDLNLLKSKLISPLAGALDEPERALQLAERYQEWDLLIRVCEATGNKERLQRYLRQFAAAGFPEFLFQWYLREGKRGRLLSAQLEHQQQARLVDFLDSQETRSLLWLQHINTGQMAHAAESLRCLAAEERELLSRKRTLLSLSKLALMSSDNVDDTEREANLAAINAELEIVSIQASLPGTLLDALGLDANAMPVYTPRELIDLFVSEHNPERSPVHFKQALDLLHFVNAESHELDELRVHIWSKAILLDDWPVQIAADDPLEEMRDTTFLQVINLCSMDDMDLRVALPRLEVLLDTVELSVLSENANFQYLMRAGYEAMEKLYRASST